MKQFVLAYVNGVIERNQIWLYNVTDGTCQFLKLDPENEGDWSYEISHTWTYKRLQKLAKDSFQHMVPGRGFQIIDSWKE